MVATTIESTVERRAFTTPLTMGMFGRRVSWAAIFSGVIATTFVQVLLSSLGAGIGANAVDANNGVSTGIGVGAGLWMFISTIVSLFIGGWMAGRLSGIPRKTEGMLHGFLTASLGTLFVLYLMTTAVRGIFGTAFNLFNNNLNSLNGNVTQQTNQAAQTAAPGVATAAYASFGLLLLGCGAAMWGGYVSAPKEVKKRAPAAV